MPLILLLLLSVSTAHAVDFTVSWKASPSTDITGYRVYVGTVSRSYDQWTDVGQVTQVVLGGLAPDILYYFTVSGLFEGGETDYANEVSLEKSSAIMDTEPPIVQITSPVNGAVVTPKSQVPITVQATDNLGVVAVEITINGKVLCTRNAPPYSCPWKVPAARRKTYVLESLAHDAAGHVGTAPPVMVKTP